MQPLTAYMSVSVPILIMLIMVAARNDSNTGIRPHTTSLPHLLCTNSNSCIRMGRCLGGRYLIPPQLKYKFWVQVCGLWLIKVVIKERQNRTNTQKDVSNCKKWTFIDITLHSLKMLGLYLYTIILGHIYCYMLSILTKFTLQQKCKIWWQIMGFWTKKVKTQQ